MRSYFQENAGYACQKAAQPGGRPRKQKIKKKVINFALANCGAVRGSLSSRPL